MTDTLPGNREAIEAWNTVLFDKFVAFRQRVSDALGIHGTRGIAHLAPPPGSRVVDIGCGFGDSTLELSDRLGPQGHVTGVDAAARFLEVARSEVGDRTNVSYVVADVESEVPGGPYDAAFSRMGTMFFNSPVFALRNIRKVLKPGGTLCMVTWRKREANRCFYDAEVVAREMFGDPPKGDQVTCGPGPFSMASADLVSDQMAGAGFTDIAFLRSDAAVLVGHSVREALDFAVTLGPAGEIIRLAGQAAVDRRGELEENMRKAIEENIRLDGTVWASSSCWLVTAKAPS